MKKMQKNKMNLMRLVNLAVLPFVLLAITACFSKKIKGVEETTVINVDEGVVVVDTLTINATVTAKDSVKRKLTLRSDEGGKTTYKAGPEVDNFDQIRVGTRIEAVVTEEVAAYIGADSQGDAAAVSGVMVSPDGSVAAGFVVDTYQIPAVVEAVDVKKHKITLKFSDGTTKKVKANKLVDLSIFQPGDDITLQLSEGLAISIQIP